MRLRAALVSLCILIRCLHTTPARHRGQRVVLGRIPVLCFLVVPVGLVQKTTSLVGITRTQKALSASEPLLAWQVFGRAAVVVGHLIFEIGLEIVASHVKLTVGLVVELGAESSAFLLLRPLVYFGGAGHGLAREVVLLGLRGSFFGDLMNARLTARSLVIARDCLSICSAGGIARLCSVLESFATQVLRIRIVPIKISFVCWSSVGQDILCSSETVLLGIGLRLRIDLVLAWRLASRWSLSLGHWVFAEIVLEELLGLDSVDLGASKVGFLKFTQLAGIIVFFHI